jgi:hypothetical protein
MNVIFLVLDKTGRNIRLTKERWNHIKQEHPDIQNNTDIKDVLLTPLKITPSKYNPNKVAYYYSYKKKLRKYLFVSVKYLNGDGFVITSYYMKKIQ